MNLLLHGVGPTHEEAAPPIVEDDSLRAALEEFEAIWSDLSPEAEPTPA